MNIAYVETYREGADQKVVKQLWANCASYQRVALPTLSQIIAGVDPKAETNKDAGARTDASAGAGAGASEGASAEADAGAAVCSVGSRTKRSIGEKSISCQYSQSLEQVKKLQDNIKQNASVYLGDAIIFRLDRKAYKWIQKDKMYKEEAKPQKMLKYAFGKTANVGVKEKLHQRTHLKPTQMLGNLQRDSNRINDEKADGLQEHVYLPTYNHLDDVQLKFANIDFLFSGYDVTRSNPFSSHGIDPGFTMGLLFNIEYKGRRTADGMYLLPSGMYARNSVACQSHAISQKFHSSEEYKQYISAHVSGEVSTGLYNGKLETEVKNKLDFLRSAESMIVSSQKVCQLYRVEINLVHPPSLSESFLQALEECDLTSTDSLKKFSHQFGSHFIYSATMGHRTGVEMLMTKSAEHKATETGVSIDMAIQAWMFGVSAGMNFDSSVAASVANSAQKKYVFSVGQEIMQDSQVMANMKAAAPITYELWPLYDLPRIPYTQVQKLKLISKFHTTYYRTEMSKEN